MSGLILRLAGPLQSWGERSAFSYRDTQLFPTRSGIIGLFACSAGLPRGADLARYEPLHLTVRIDDPGTVITDFHTIGGGRPPAQTVMTADGKRRPKGEGTIVTQRDYLSGAVFTVAVQGPEATLTELAGHLRSPHWQPYLGRRSCPPDQPLLLKAGVADPHTELTQHVPLPRNLAEGAASNVDFVYEDAAEDAHTRTQLSDDPVTFSSLERTYRTRWVSRRSVQVAETLWHGRTRDYYDALFAYAFQGAPR